MDRYEIIITFRPIKVHYGKVVEFSQQNVYLKQNVDIHFDMREYRLNHGYSIG
jgi:hypothetical protein